MSESVISPVHYFLWKNLARLQLYSTTGDVETRSNKLSDLSTESKENVQSPLERLKVLLGKMSQPTEPENLVSVSFFVIAFFYLKLFWRDC